jgi:hypothetical protein
MKPVSVLATFAVIAITALFATHSLAQQQRTIYDREGNVAGRYTTDTQGTTTLYGRDGRVISRSTGGTIVMDGVGGTIIPDRHAPYVDGKIRKDRR